MDLKKPLEDLNNFLIKNNLYLEITVIGAFALQLHGLSSRITMDIDTISSLKNILLLNEISKIGKKYGINNWLNNQANNMIMPDGYKSRLLLNNDFSNINMKYVSKIDLIKLKVAAYFYRSEYEDKDYLDLISLKPTTNELKEAIAFLKTKHAPEEKESLELFLEIVNNIHKELKDISNG